MFDLAIEFANIEPDQCTKQNIARLFATHNFCSEKHLQNGYFDKTILFGDLCIDLLNGNSQDESLLCKWALDVKKEINNLISSFIHSRNYCEHLLKIVDEVDVKISVKKDAAGFPVGLCLVCGSKNTKHQIMFREFIEPILNGNSKEIERICRCRNCNRVFYAKDIRKQFCSTKCKNSNAYMRKKSKS